MIRVSEALEVIAANAPALEAESVALGDALGRVLASDLAADVDWPPFDTSAMDGYAIRLADVPAPGARLPERGRAVMAGDAPPGPLPAGETVRVMTGAPIPPGTEAIIPVEQARANGGAVIFEHPPAAGAHLRRRGESIRAGSVLVAAGRRLTPGDVALAALGGADPVRVTRRPRIAIAATGNELVAPGGRPRPGQIRDSNGPMLVALCRARGWDARRLPNASDDEAGLAALFSTGTEEADVLITSGGVSAGDLDLVPAAAERRGFEILFHGVSVRPGKPVAFGKRGRTLWFGLPGNPVSSSVCFHLFARDALDRLEGCSAPGAPRARVPLAGELPRNGPRETYRDARISANGGVTSVEPLATAGSHDIRAHAAADALIRIPAGAEAQVSGAVVECVLL
ncbi:MAG TPA: gephyrin-like molybdotransferase Glp [Thermoanaerobaculia bacterium]|nr:gephyrin-like molybdotransferase Glp [Thermoanaerobaculia bacterium]